MPNDEFFANGVIIDVMDGDTVRLKLSMGVGEDTIDPDEDGIVYIRLAGIDTPETENRRWAAQPKSVEAKQKLVELLLDKRVTARLKGDRTYGRAVGEIFVDGTSANREMVREGLAWWNKKYELYDLDYERLQEQAKGDEENPAKGIWQDSDPTPPWIWRRTGGNP